MTIEKLAELLKMKDCEWCQGLTTTLKQTVWEAMAAGILARYDLVPKGEKV